MAEQKEVFLTLNNVDCSERVEKKKVDNKGKELSYLSWAWAWAEVKKRYPNTTYEILKFNGLPYVFDPDTGYMVYTTVTIDGITHEMWLPVMDSHNAAMKKEPYVVKTKFSTYTVAAATMFDINKAIMRCLTKNLAMFGLGLYIYAGEDLPEGITEENGAQTVQENNQPINELPDDVCTICHLPVTPYDAKDKEGKLVAHYPKSIILEKSIAEFGSPVCMSCWMKKNARDKAKAEKAELKAMNKDAGEYQALIHEDAGDRD